MQIPLQLATVFKWRESKMNSDKYHGIPNKGATCYLNSVLQVLFWTKDFREAVERHTSGNPEFTDLLRALFDDLQSSDQRTADTSEIISKLGINSVYEQRDAAEYLEKILRLTSPEVSQVTTSSRLSQPFLGLSL
uniref:ubiquitin carboxyl-terminal hydrolase creB-like isoform X2 n=1 Tax=Monopterus albus TaxID=43700 RepID=UPI0009B327B5|nr:ubiquitin carboxyl-terminal hydrolase creB-like isoform X2 [Monopterus albus]